MSTLNEPVKDGTSITVIGIGGAGGNAVNHMIEKGIAGVTFVTANTDAQALSRTGAPTMLQLGESGLGAGANPEVGRETAKEAKKKIAEVLQGAHMVFVTAGMGGGTGTGAAPVIAAIAREMGILTVGVVTRPFDFEGRKRAKQASEGIEELSQSVDSLIVVLNDRLLEVLGDDVTQDAAFKAADNVLHTAVSGVTEIISTHGHVNVDFNDVRTIMTARGRGMMGIGVASGADRAVVAAEQAISCPLLEGVNLASAKGVLVNVTAAASTLKLSEATAVMTTIRKFVDEDNAMMKYGVVYDESMGDTMRVTVVATGLEDAPVAAAKPIVRAPASQPPRPSVIPTLTEVAVERPRKVAPVVKADPYEHMERPAVFRNGRSLPPEIAAEEAPAARPMVLEAPELAPVSAAATLRTPVTPSLAKADANEVVSDQPAEQPRQAPARHGLGFEDCIPAFLRRKAA